MVEDWQLDKVLRLLSTWKSQGAIFHFLVATPSGVRFMGFAWPRRSTEHVGHKIGIGLSASQTKRDVRNGVATDDVGAHLKT